MFRSKFEAIPDDLTGDEVLEQARKAAQKVRQRLDLKKVNTKVRISFKMTILYSFSNIKLQFGEVVQEVGAYWFVFDPTLNRCEMNHIIGSDRAELLAFS